MLPRNEALAVLKHLDGLPFRGALHRAVHLFVYEENPHFNPLFSQGSAQRGARFTQKGGMPTLYVTEESATALAEANQVAAILDSGGAPPGPISPTVVYSFDVYLPGVLDLTNAETLRVLQVTAGELEAPWELLQARGERVPTQDLGLWTFESGRFTAIRFKSKAQSTGHCFAIFTERIVAPAHVRILDNTGVLEGQLPTTP